MPFAVARFNWDAEKEDYFLKDASVIKVGLHTVSIDGNKFQVLNMGECIHIYIENNKALGLPMLPDTGGDDTTMSEIYELGIPFLPFIAEKLKYSGYGNIKNLVWVNASLYPGNDQDSLIWFKDEDSLAS